MTYTWLNEHRLTAGLDQITDPDELDDVLDALEAIADTPTEDCPLVARMKGTHDHTDRWIGLLPHGWVIVYSIYPDGVAIGGPPAPSLVVRSFTKRFDI